MLSLYRQQYGADGGLDARSADNAIGRTSLGLWDLVLRESLQNSWDARTAKNGRISFSVDEYEMSLEQTRILTQEVFGELPPHCKSTDLHKHIFDHRIRVLVISDTGTRGLGGPIRADVSGTSGERRDFVDFVRNLGRSTTKGLEGGTYGLGKGVLYRASQLGLCLIYSQAYHNGSIEPRLIAVSGGDGDYDDDDSRYTGRNWWGVPGADGIVDPLTGSGARELAESLGMRIPMGDDTGTSIMVVAPDFAGVTNGRDRVAAIADAAMKWAWPHALDTGSGPNVRFQFTADNGSVPGPEPLNHPVYREFASAYIEGRKRIMDPTYESNWQTTYTPIRSKRPNQGLGLLTYRISHTPVATGSELENSVALLRDPRMVVKYLPVSAQPNGVPVFGVFISTPEMNEKFAKSEPVTHDDWVYQQAAAARNFPNPVRIALDKIRETFRVLSVQGAKAGSGVASKGASRVSAALGSLLSGFSGNGAEQQAVGSSEGLSTKRPRKASIRQLAESSLDLLDGEMVAKYGFAVTGGRPGNAVAVRVAARVVTESGGNEAASPAEAEMPRFIGWMSSNGLLSSEEVLTVPVPSEDEITAVFTQPADAAIRVTATVEELEIARS
ncbi:hypothetical protein SAMN04487914_11829 [Arthrobacter sp. ok909]|uniref:hypothetical protein n=1 Tax=Arthrobacter sp. ok909 TaxID=1761746 RepID=UPI000881A06E|nr:hypothetical protein [Arthrobacter sp. ok909]SDP57996.1 hypothetical protein SAMN04487914_11829 [Arthrobacter sp. ok909]